MIEAPALAALSGLRHGFFTRRGGVSRGLYDSLNGGFGSNDDEIAVAENRRRAVDRLGLSDAPLCTVYQCHGVDCVTVTAPWPRHQTPRADAMATNRRGVVLGVLTADCVPLILADHDAAVIGVAHAGWKGALGGVVEAAVDAMIGLGAAPLNIIAVTGPSIGPESYEVGAEFRVEFIADDPRNDDFFITASRAGHYLFDLAGYVSRRLDKLDIGMVQALPHDTYADERRFFSYRRCRHKGEQDYGRLLSMVALELN